MKNKLKYLILILFLTFASCKKDPAIEGLWVVKKVKVGEEEMTPNGRWTRFNADNTQESGNGWLQHSHGTWNFNQKTGELSITNANGINDPYEPFVVILSQDGMTWKRTEDGHAVEVLLKRSDRLPETYADQLLGLWQLEEANGRGPYFEGSESPEKAGYVFFRWDKRFVIGTGNGRINGVYNVHGHKPEVELIPYGDQYSRDFWKIQFNEKSITLELLNSDSTITRTFKRIHEFPN